MENVSCQNSLQTHSLHRALEIKEIVAQIYQRLNFFLSYWFEFGLVRPKIGTLSCNTYMIWADIF